MVLVRSTKRELEERPSVADITLADDAPDLRRQRRAEVARSQSWGAVALAACEDLEERFPDWHLWFSRFPGWGFVAYRRIAWNGPRLITEGTPEDLAAQIAEVESRRAPLKVIIKSDRGRLLWRA